MAAPASDSAVADGALARGGNVYGVIPGHLAAHEISHTGLTELIVTGTMHERKTAMADMADGFIALPGGLGTLEELAEVCTWQQIGLHRKPTGILNINQYYRSLLEFLTHATDQAFLRPAHRNNILSADSPTELLDKMTGFAADPDQHLSKKILPEQ